MWNVEVKFWGTEHFKAVTKGYRLSREEALKEARAYWSDSLGIRIVNCYGSSEQVK
jgi:hypothetical protein